MARAPSGQMRIVALPGGRAENGGLTRRLARLQPGGCLNSNLHEVHMVKFQEGLTARVVENGVVFGQDKIIQII